MQVRILDLDGGVARQPRLRQRARQCLPLLPWGPRLRMGCSWAAFRRFEADLAGLAQGNRDRQTTVTFVGSGDFHHVSLALLARQPRLCNVLVIDNHPDWVRRVPFLHCGTWLAHAARLPQVHRIFHVGGDVDFDNHYRWLAPWDLLASGKVRVLPAVRTFRGAGWRTVPHAPLRLAPDVLARRRDVERLLDPWRDDLESLPLYVSLDRDVLCPQQAVVNWDSGRLQVSEVLSVVGAFLDASASLAAADVVGDWSPVRVSGVLRRFLHHTEHPRLAVDPDHARQVNEELNLTLLDTLAAARKVSSARRLAA
jgi:hypothetical protein